MTGEYAEVKTQGMLNICMHIPCDKCNARVGEACKDRYGQPVRVELPAQVHHARLAPVLVIYRIGYQNGRRDIKKELGLSGFTDRNRLV